MKNCGTTEQAAQRSCRISILEGFQEEAGQASNPSQRQKENLASVQGGLACKGLQGSSNSRILIQLIFPSRFKTHTKRSSALL